MFLNLFVCVRLLIKAGGGEKKREFIHKSALERGVIERHEAKNKTKQKRYTPIKLLLFHREKDV